MKEDKKLTFLESIAVSAATGAACGCISEFGKIPDQNRELFTGLSINYMLDLAQQIKQKDKKGYFKPEEN